MSEGYDATELAVLAFVLLDVLIVLVLVFAGVWPALALTALFVVTGLVAWFLKRRLDVREAEATADPDPVTRLKTRYAEGELTEAEFERKLDRLLEADRRADDEFDGRDDGAGGRDDGAGGRVASEGDPAVEARESERSR